MIELVRSRVAMALASGLAGFWALAAALGGLAAAVLDRQELATSRNLVIAAAWLQFAGGVAALAAVCAVAWQMALRRRWGSLGETTIASVATFLLAVGLLLSATTAPGDSGAGDVVAAVGVGGWMILTVVRAARRSFVELGDPEAPRQARWWLVATGGLLLVAVAVGLPLPSVRQVALAVVEDVLFAVGIGALAVAVVAGRGGRGAGTRYFTGLVVGLATLVGARVVGAVAAGIVLGPSATLTGVRIGSALPAFLEAAAWIVLSLTALGRHYELAPLARGGGDERPPSTAGTDRWEPPSPVPGAPPPAGWYASVGRPGYVRWWDGAAWGDEERPSPPD